MKLETDRKATIELENWEEIQVIRKVLLNDIKGLDNEEIRFLNKIWVNLDKKAVIHHCWIESRKTGV